MNKPPRLIVGLGNPGPEYESTRHNIGFWFVDSLAKQMGLHFQVSSKFFGLSTRNQDLWLLKPTTFMNKSGLSVSALTRFYKIAPEEVLIIHDELDLPPGAIRLKQGGGNGGHNGLKDIQAQLASPNFWRLRLGIGHPGSRPAVVSYVLNPPRKEEQQAIEQAIDRCLLESINLLAGRYAEAQQKLHGKPS